MIRLLNQCISTLLSTEYSTPGCPHSQQTISDHRNHGNNHIQVTYPNYALKKNA